jgi:hypothetical protein
MKNYCFVHLKNKPRMHSSINSKEGLRERERERTELKKTNDK